VARYLLYGNYMDSSGHLPLSESAARSIRKTRAQRKPKRGKRITKGAAVTERPLAAVGTLSRTKSLLLAALRVWELKHRISD
jgi:hypothetical protein